KADSGNAKTGPLVNPGTYTLKLIVDGQTYTGTVDVAMDPRVHLASADLDEQRRFALAVRDDISRLANIVIRLRSVRTQLAGRNEVLKDDTKAEALVKSSKEMIGKLDALEAKLHNRKAEVAYDILAQRGGAKLFSQLIFLLEFARDSDGPPTQ